VATKVTAGTNTQVKINAMLSEHGFQMHSQEHVQDTELENNRYDPTDCQKVALFVLTNHAGC
jgi:hypothetical protein